MDDRDRQAQTGSLDEHEEEGMGQLFESAGPRSEIPAEDLDVIMTAATMAWRRELKRRSNSPEAVVSAEAVGRTSAERFWSAPRGLFAALAAMLILVVGVVWWWSANHLGTAERALRSARIEAVTDSVFIVEMGRSRRLLEVGDEVPVGAILSSEALTSEADAIGAQTDSDGPSRDRQPGRASLRLTNGLILRLDIGTHVRLVESSVVDLLRGAVYVDSDDHGDRSKDRLAALDRTAIGEETDRSFEQSMIEIRTPLGVAHDVGTQFVVRLLGRTDERPQSLLVRVREGEVVTEQSDGSYRAGAGEELVLAMDGEIERRAVTGFGPEWEWVLEAAPAFDAEGRTLQEFLAWTSRETGWTFEFEGDLAESADAILLHGDLSGLRPDRALFTVLPSAGLEAERTGDRLIIRRQR